MTELANINKTMSSREIAQITGKRHADLLRDIRVMENAWVKVTERKFAFSEYTDATGRKLPQYELNKKECLYIATKFNDEARAKLVLRWEKLETLDFSNPDTVLQLAQNWKNEQQRRLLAEKEAERLRPKAELMDRVMDTDEKIDIGQTAKILGLPFGRNTLFKKLREMGVFFKNRNEPKYQYIKRGYFELKEQYIERNNHDGFIVVKVLVTQKGLAFIAKLFNVEQEPKQLAKVC